jgi:class 3 adenylate cyclase
MRGDGVSGIAVHMGARVAALAGTGEVLVSSTVKDLVAGSGSSSRTAASTSSRGSGRVAAIRGALGRRLPIAEAVCRVVVHEAARLA